MREIILAMNPGGLGDMTAGYVKAELATLGKPELRITALARGLSKQ